APPPEAAVGSGRDLRPDGVGRLDGQPGPVARVGRIDPFAHRLEPGRVLGPWEELPAEELEALQRMTAEVVLPALQDGDADLPAERRRTRRDVLRQQLLLRRLRRRRDDAALPGFEW